MIACELLIYYNSKEKNISSATEAYECIAAAVAMHAVESPIYYMYFTSDYGQRCIKMATMQENCIEHYTFASDFQVWTNEKDGGGTRNTLIMK